MTGTSLLVIDDDPGLHTLVDFHLEGVVDKISHAVTPAQGLRMAADLVPTVILLDVKMPKMDGFAVCRQLKDNDLTRGIPIIFLTCDKAAVHIRKALESGGSDYVTKPFEPIELQARVRTAIRTSRLIELLKQESRIDALTGLSNRAGLERALTTAISRHTRHGEPFSVLMLDLDHFKTINDTYGHGMGDEVLRRVSAVIKGTCRPYDYVVRYGGDEFTVIIARSGEKEAEHVSQRVLQEIRKIKIRVTEDWLSVTCSAGLACESRGNSKCQPDAVLKHADAALYDAKNRGRNRLAVSPHS